MQSDKPTLEELRLKRNERNRLWYADHKEAIRQKRQAQDPQIRKDYYAAHKDTILNNQRKAYKNRRVSNFSKKLEALIDTAPEALKPTLRALKPDIIDKHFITSVQKMIDSTVEMNRNDQ